MELLNFIFQLGVLFAIYGFLWGVFEIIIAFFSANRTRSLMEIYIIRGLKYLFLVHVTFIFCFESASSNVLAAYKTIFAGLILLTYFTGKLQKNQLKSVFFSISRGNLMSQNIYFNLRYEKIIIGISLFVFSLLWFVPDAAINPISIWFRDAIINIENTPVFGFIFKVIGFFFLLNIIGKMIASVNYFISGEKTPNDNNDFNNPNSIGNDSDSGDFVDYEEVE